MTGRSGLVLKYHLPDEPTPSLLSRFAIAPFWLLPATVYLGLVYSLFFFLLPGLNALLIGGHTKWRSLGYSVLSVVLFVFLAVARGMAAEAGLIGGLLNEYARDAVLSIAVFPLLLAVVEQGNTIALRDALRD